MRTHQNEQNGASAKGVTRRSFLKAGGVGAAAVAAAPVAGAAAAGASKGKRLAMVIDLQKCTGCGGCILTCKNENNIQYGVKWSNKITRTVGTFPNVRYEYLPTLCNHCSNAPCAKACPTGAMHKGYGDITKHTPDKCIGCKTCIAVCPYEVISTNKRAPHPFWQDGRVVIKGATSSARDLVKQVGANTVPYYNAAKEEMAPGGGLRYKGIAEKCTFCDHRVEKGKLPYCVTGCPADARIFGDLNDPNSDVSKLLARYRPWRLKEKLGTEPKVFYIRDFNAGASQAGKGSA
jgi:molybdopterin-containing oxidoreductase family iron-sulfur binding subunit